MYKFCDVCMDKSTCAKNKACKVSSSDADFSVDASLQNANDPELTPESDPPFRDTCLNCGYVVKEKSGYAKHQDETGHGLFALINNGKKDYDRTA